MGFEFWDSNKIAKEGCWSYYPCLEVEIEELERRERGYLSELRDYVETVKKLRAHVEELEALLKWKNEYIPRLEGEIATAWEALRRVRDALPRVVTDTDGSVGTEILVIVAQALEKLKR